MPEKTGALYDWSASVPLASLPALRTHRKLGYGLSALYFHRTTGKRGRLRSSQLCTELLIAPVKTNSLLQKQAVL
ncbi:MAG TPA: hypothetical protein VEF04_12295 [Blastocatellia bacterium]|nr:hypothetical protein [Blastocatellia bacterium]